MSHGVGLDRAITTLTFPQYKDWRHYGRLEGAEQALARDSNQVERVCGQDCALEGFATLARFDML